MTQLQIIKSKILPILHKHDIKRVVDIANLFFFPYFHQKNNKI